MNELFGIPLETLLVILGVAMAMALGALAALALRNPLLFKLGSRNVGRRRARTALIVLGLMLGTTIISSALVTGDTMSHTIRSSAITSLGETDELVSVRGADVNAEVELGSTTGVEYFSQEVPPGGGVRLPPPPPSPPRRLPPRVGGAPPPQGPPPGAGRPPRPLFA